MPEESQRRCCHIPSARVTNDRVLEMLHHATFLPAREATARLDPSSDSEHEVEKLSSRSRIVQVSHDLLDVLDLNVHGYWLQTSLARGYGDGQRPARHDIPEDVGSQESLDIWFSDASRL